MLRLDPLMLAAAQASETGLMNSLRREFGHEAHLAVTGAGQAVFVMAARAGRDNEVAVATRRRMAAIAPDRLTGSRPGILAMFIEDTGRAEWRHLREQLELEGEARQFLTGPAARCVVAVTCASRLELFGIKGPDGVDGGDLRFGHIFLELRGQIRGQLHGRQPGGLHVIQQGQGNFSIRTHR